jgi:hypothetical protein
VFENRVLRILLRPKRCEVTGERGKLHSGELRNLYASLDIIWHMISRKIKWVAHVEGMVDGRNVNIVLLRKNEGKSPLERPRRRWENGIKMELWEIVWGCGVDSPGSG